MQVKDDQDEKEAKSVQPFADEPAQSLLTLEIQAMKVELQRLNSYRLLSIYDSVPKLLWFQFLKGTAFGLGSLVGATIVLSIGVYFMSKIAFLPIIGTWLKELMVLIKVP